MGAAAQAEVFRALVEKALVGCEKDKVWQNFGCSGPCFEGMTLMEDVTVNMMVELDELGSREGQSRG